MEIEKKELTINVDAVNKAKRLISEGKYITPESWNPPSAEQENEYIEKYGFDEFGKWHLAYDNESNPETKGAYKFIYTSDFENVDRKGLIAIRQRAGQFGYTEIFEQAGILLNMIDEQENAKQKRQLNVNFETKVDGEIIEFIINTSDLDREKEIVNPNGCRFENYLKNPIVLFNHDVTKPLGRCEQLLISDDRIIAKTRLNDDDILDPYLKSIINLIKNGTLRAASIGFIPLKWHFEQKEVNGEKVEVRIFDEWELVEYSIVAIPSNPNALRKAGRTISRQNMEKIKQMKNFLLQVIAIIEEFENYEIVENIEKPEEKNLNEDFKPSFIDFKHFIFSLIGGKDGQKN